MRTLRTTFFLGLWLTACQRTTYYYLVTAPTNLLESPSEQSPIMASLQIRDTLLTHKRISSTDTHFIKVRHQATRGYVRPMGCELLDSSRYQTAYGRWVSSLRFNPELNFTFKSGRNKSNSTGSVRTYRNSRSIETSRSASPSDRSVGSGNQTGRGRGPR